MQETWTGEEFALIKYSFSIGLDLRPFFLFFFLSFYSYFRTFVFELLFIYIFEYF